MLKGNQVRTLTFKLGQFGSRSCNTNARKLAAPIARATGVYRNGIALVFVRVLRETIGKTFTVEPD